MKKIMLYALAALSVAACGTKKSDTAVVDAPDVVDEGDVYYEGILPAADVDGIRYSLALDFDDDSPEQGDYKLTETYLKDGGSPVSSFFSEGDFEIKTGTPTDSAARYLVLVPEIEAGQTPGETLYFLAESDSTLTLVGADLAKPESSGLNYTIKRVNSLTR